MSASITTSRNVFTTSRAVAATSAAQATSRAVVVSSQPASSQIVSSRSTTRRARTTTASATPTPTQTFVPFDASSERRADSQRTNNILIGIFTGLGVILLGVVAFQLLRCYKRRRKSNSTPLPPPREGTMSQLGYRHSRGVSMYKEFSAAEFGRPPSMMKHASGSGFVDTPSVRSNAASMEKLGADEPRRTSSDPRRSTGQIPREASPDNSLVDSTIVDSTPAPTDEEMGRRLSPLGSRSDSPSNLSLPRPPSQAQVPRPESRARYPRPNSVASTTRHSYLAPSWQYGSAQRNSVHGSLRPTSYYASGNHGAPHSPHARDRVGLVMPQPLAPELFNYALSGRHDMGLDFTQGGWGSHGNLANPQDSNSTLPPPTHARTDSWAGQSQTPSSSDSPLTSDAPAKDGSLPRGRSSRPEIPQP